MNERLSRTRVLMLLLVAALRPGPKLINAQTLPDVSFLASSFLKVLALLQLHGCGGGAFASNNLRHDDVVEGLKEESKG
jgi:hypothetical protein